MWRRRVTAGDVRYGCTPIYQVVWNTATWRAPPNEGRRPGAAVVKTVTVRRGSTLCCTTLPLRSTVLNDPRRPRRPITHITFTNGTPRASDSADAPSAHFRLAYTRTCSTQCAHAPYSERAARAGAGCKPSRSACRGEFYRTARYTRDSGRALEVPPGQGVLSWVLCGVLS